MGCMDGMQKWPAEAIQIIRQLQQENKLLKEKINILEKDYVSMRILIHHHLKNDSKMVAEEET